MTSLNPFHLAFPVDDLDKAREFYTGVLGCAEGRSSKEWVDFNFFGHQLVAHLAPRPASEHRNAVDGHDVPVPHFGVVLSWEDFHILANGIRASGIRLEAEPYIRFEGEVGEQVTMFFYDGSGNALEFKAFRNPGQLFAK
jgi:uncharacterized protein